MRTIEEIEKDAMNAKSVEEAFDIAVEAIGLLDCVIGNIETPRLLEICNAERDGRCVVLPCKVGDMVYTIQEEHFDCENCPYGNEARWNPAINQVGCDVDDRHCPYSVKEHKVEGYMVSGDSNGAPSVSDPGEWGYEGLEAFYGADGKWYPTRETALKGAEHDN